MNSIPILVLLHGTRLTGAQWTGYAERLADVAEVRTPDLPGHGRRAHQAFTLAAAVQTVESVVAAAGERPVLLAGHSLGGFVAMSYAEQHPTRLGGLALMGSATEPGGPGAGVYRLLARLWALAGPARMQRLDARVLGRLLDTRIWAAIQAEGEYFGAVDAAWSEVMRHCGSHQLRHVACPVLVLGGRWDQLHLQARRFARAARHRRHRTRSRPFLAHDPPRRSGHPTAPLDRCGATPVRATFSPNHRSQNDRPRRPRRRQKP